MESIPKKESILVHKNHSLLEDSSLIGHACYQQQKPRTGVPAVQLRDVFDISERKELSRMKVMFRNKATQFYNKEIQAIVNNEVKRIKEKEKVKSIVETLKNPDNKENFRARHHLQVAKVAEHVKQRELQNSLDKLQQFMAKKDRVQQRVNAFLKQRDQKIVDRLSATSQVNRSVVHNSTLCTIQRSNSRLLGHVWQDKTKPQTSRSCRQTDRREVLARKRRQEQDIKVSSLMNRMKVIQCKLAQRQIQVHDSIREKRKAPVKCLTNLRNLNQQSWRLQAEKTYQQHSRVMDSKLQSMHQSSYQSMLRKTFANLQRTKTVSQKKRQMSQENISRKTEAAFSTTGFSTIDLKKQSQEKVLLLKRQFQVRKQFQEERNRLLMRKLVDKVSDLKQIDSRARLPPTEVANFNKLLSQMVGENYNTEIFEQAKCKVAEKLVSSEQARDKQKPIKKTF